MLYTLSEKKKNKMVLWFVFIRENIFISNGILCGRCEKSERSRTEPFCPTKKLDWDPLWRHRGPF
uniref:Uncharacterized protein n=1 Tax=Anguilla anguilla TaxID=7936 RepID=A0A0E9SR72_ANGAN